MANTIDESKPAWACRVAGSSEKVTGTALSVSQTMFTCMRDCQRVLPAFENVGGLSEPVVYMEDLWSVLSLETDRVQTC